MYSSSEPEEWPATQSSSSVYRFRLMLRFDDLVCSWKKIENYQIFLSKKLNSFLKIHICKVRSQQAHSGPEY